MKKTLCSLLCAVLLLTFSGCGNGEPETPVAPSTSVATTTTEAMTTTTVPTLSQAEEQARYYDQLLDEFLAAWKAGDEETLYLHTASSEIAAQLAAMTVEAYELERSTDDKPHVLHLSVSKSTLPEVPTGESDWWIQVDDRYDGMFVILCPIDEDYADRWAYLDLHEELPIRFCAGIAGELALFDTVADCSRLSPQELGAKGGTLVRIHNAWLKATEEDSDLPSHMTVSELSAFAEQVLGVTVTDFSKSPTYTPPTETGEAQVELGAYGGLWYYGGLMEHTRNGDIHTVTIRYYADRTRLVEAVTMRYTVKELNGGLRLLSCERLSGGTYPPVRGTT